MCKHIADLFGTVFGPDSVGSGKRVRPLLAGQVSYPAVINEGLRYIETVFGPPNRFFHGIAGAPYFGIPGDINTNPALTVDDIFRGANVDMKKLVCSRSLPPMPPPPWHIL